MLRCLGTTLLVLPAHGGFVRPPLVRGIAVSPPADTDEFPWSDDFRDPNTAWSGSDKAVFLLVYGAFWVLVCILVRCWPSIARVAQRVSCCLRRELEATTARAPLLEADTEMDSKEVNVGATPKYPADKRIFQLFEDRVSEMPTSTALVNPDNGRETTYRDLNAAIDELKEMLLSIGIARGECVALILDRSVAQVIAVYGVLKAGAAFLPIDIAGASTRKQFVVMESEAGAVIAAQGDEKTQELWSDLLKHIPLITLPPEGGKEKLTMLRPRANSRSLTPRDRSASKDGCRFSPAEYTRPEAGDMALLIYTSGTTGTPKGIVYDHAHLMHGAHFFGDHCRMSANSVAMLKSPYFWAVMEWEVFPALARGGKLVVASATGHKSPEYLADVIYKQQVTVLMITPQVLDLVLDIHESQRSLHPLRSLEHVVTVGEPLACAVANRTMEMRNLSLNCELHNFYGASESSCTVYTVPPEGIDLRLFPNKAPAGIPQPHVKVYIMKVLETEVVEGDEAPPVRFEQVPTGQPGEICFGGVMAAGYWKHDELTEKKFVDAGAPYGILYRTGDRGRWKAGLLEVLGRTDRQVKIRGVRVEPEEVEAVLKRYMVQDESDGIDTEGGVGMRAALKEVSVVASKEPSELVAFVSMRDGISGVTVEMLRTHCQSQLTPSYMPKFFVILPALPQLPNGKPNLAALVEQATQHVVEEGSVVMDSLGQMKKLSKWAVFENAVIHRCYTYWMIGVLTDHYMRCALDTDADANLYPFCSPLARQSVKPWTEILLRSFGNDQDMFGFIMLGAYQDSRPDMPGKPPRVKLGLKDLFIFAVYMCMAMPFPQLLHYVLGPVAWPESWGGYPAPKNAWNYDYMQLNSNTSDHRWYLLMVLQARLWLQLCESLHLRGWMAGILITIPCLLPSSVFEGKEYAFDFCQGHPTAPTYSLWFFSWLWRNWGSGCPMYWRWISWYVAFYTWSFHYLRPFVDLVKGRLPTGRTWAAAALGSSMMIGVSMALFHYPNHVLEDGTHTNMAWLEIGVDFLQPALFALGMTHLPLNMAWWGNTTLGCYVFHFYFRDHATSGVIGLANGLTWDDTGLILFITVVLACFAMTTIVGPIGHYILLSPSLFSGWVQRRGAASRRARAQAAQARCVSTVVDPQIPRVETEVSMPRVTDTDPAGAVAGQ